MNNPTHETTPDPIGRLVADLREAIRQHRGDAVPTEHVRTVLARYTRQLPEPRPIDPYEASANPLMDRVVEALRILGCTGPAHAEDILAVANTHLSVRERAHVLDRLDPNQDPQDRTSDGPADRDGRSFDTHRLVEEIATRVAAHVLLLLDQAGHRPTGQPTAQTVPAPAPEGTEPDPNPQWFTPVAPAGGETHE